MDKKYELVKEDSIEFNGITLYRIRALKDFEILTHSTIHKGDLGGYVQSENNLSQKGNCWVSDNACVYGNACVSDNACVADNACVYDNAKVYDNARVYGEARIRDNAMVFDNAYVFGNAWVCDNAYVCDNAKVCNNAKVYGYAVVQCNAEVGNNARICNDTDYLYINGLGDIYPTITFYKCKDNQIGVNCDFFTGNLDDFVIVLKKGKDNKYNKEYLAAIKMVKIHFDLV